MGPHLSPWTGLPCVRRDCDGVGHVSVSTSYNLEPNEQATEYGSAQPEAAK